MISNIISAIFRTNGAIGVDIGSHSVKLARASCSKSRINFIEGGSFNLNLPEDADSEQRISVISSALRKFIKEKNISCRNAAILLSGNDVKVSIVNTKRQLNEDMAEVCAREADNLFSKDDDLLITYSTISEKMVDGVNELCLVFAAAKKELVRERIQIVEQAGLSPVLIMPSVFAVESLSRKLKVFSNGEVLFVNTGSKFAEMCIFSDGHVKALRTVSVGSSTINSRIAQFLRIPEEDTEEIKRKYSVPDTDEEKAIIIENFNREEAASVAAQTEYINALSAEIDPFVYLSEAEIYKIFISGGPSCGAGYAKCISSKLDIPVFTLPEQEKLKKKVFKRLGANAPELLPAAAASISYELGGDFTKMNLLPADCGKEEKKLASKIRIAFYILMAFLAAGLIMLRGTESSLKAHLRDKKTETKAAEVAAQAPELETIEQDTESVLEYINQAEEIMNKRKLWAALIKNLMTGLPEDTAISSLSISYENGNIGADFKLSSKAKNSIEKMLETLKKNENLENVSAGEITKLEGADKGYISSVSVSYKGDTHD